ncbi:amino acid permease [Allostreptomyces psammosilenae]|nr:amino acid permease [Allostreptomyces psammosilenae]
MGGAPADGGRSGLQHGLRRRHLSMLGLGGVIGAGLFVGSGAGIAAAGPGILVSYLLAGGLVTLIMRMLGEMSAAEPASGSFSVHAERSLGRWAGFTVGWLYWWLLVVVLAVEATGAAGIAHGWVPAVPQWAWVLVFMVVLTAANLAAVRNFGEFEFWFAAVKVVTIVGFLLLGGLAVLGVLPDVPAPGLSNLTGHGGFFPNGLDGVVVGLLAVAFSFGGLEVVTIAAAESDDPRRSVGSAVRTAVWRILLFYVGSVAVIVTLLPWDSAEVGASPYVAVLDRLGVPGAAGLMDAVVFLALLSALNANLYGASRMVYSLAERGQAPRPLLRTSRSGSPRVAVLASVAFGFVSVLFNYWWPDTVFLFMLNSVGALLLVVWGFVAAAQLRMRRRLEREAPERLTVRMWAFPYLTWLAVAGLGGVLLLMLGDAAARQQLLSAGVLAAVILAVALLREVLRRRRAEEAPRRDA